MTPAPTLQDLIATVRTDAASDDELDQLSAASQLVAGMEEVADATMAHFVDQCRRNGRSWTEISRALGVTKQAAHKRFSPTPPALTLGNRFTSRARALLEAAAAEARRLSHNYVGTEHLLLGIFGDMESVAAKVLTEAGVTHAQVETRVLEVTPRGPSPVEGPPFTPRAATCIEKSVAEALQLGHNYVGTEHMLLALFTDPESFAAQILNAAGATYEELRDRIIAKLARLTSKP